MKDYALKCKTQLYFQWQSSYLTRVPKNNHFVLVPTDMVRRYNQLHTFVKCGMVPTFVDGVMGENPVIGHGRLNKLWLGGLVNPEALLTAIKQEKAVVTGCSIDDVSHCLKHVHWNERIMKVLKLSYDGKDL